MVDGLPKEALLVRENGPDGIDELGEVGELDGAALADEAVEIRPHREGVGQIELLLDATHPVLGGASAIPDVPLVESHVDGMSDALGVAHPLEERAAEAHRALRLMG